jgi:hypothetical protein
VFRYLHPISSSFYQIQTLPVECDLITLSSLVSTDLLFSPDFISLKFVTIYYIRKHHEFHYHYVFMVAILKHFKVSRIATVNRFQKQFVVDN